jgi:hypothetical protein
MKKEVKILPIDFIGKGEVRGFIFNQVARGQKSCLYEVTTEGITHYEVFKLKVWEAPGSRDLYEAYPKANSFGVWAWTFRNKKEAITKFRSLEK